MTKRRWTNWFICERSGQPFPISQMVIEPGTGYKVARKFCDYGYSLNSHPQNFVPDKRPIEEASLYPTTRPDTQVDEMNYLVDENFTIIVDNTFQPVIY